MLARSNETPAGRAGEERRDAILDQHRVMRRNGLRLVLPWRSRATEDCKKTPEAGCWSLMNHRILRWGRLAVLPVIMGLGLGVFTSPVHPEAEEKPAKESASKLYEQAQAPEAAGDIAAAVQLYARAFQKSPKD